MNGWTRYGVLLGVVVLVGCGPMQPQTRAVSSISQAEVLVPQMRPGTDPAAFARGQVLFEHEFTVQEGLGPDYNATSCKACHSIPVVGGAGDLAHAINGTPRFVNGVVQPGINGGFFRTAPSLLGLGYIQDVPDAVVEANCGVNQPLGIQGATAHTGNWPNKKLSRWGRKLPAINLLDFSSHAAFGEMRLNNVASSDEHATDGGPNELTVQQVQDLAAFVGGLDRPPALNPDLAGRTLFENIGCATCHVLESQGLWRDGTDGCGHDLGQALADDDGDNPIGPNRWRTTSFIGMRFRPGFMRDQRAATVDDATRMHGGEATKVVQAYVNLSPTDRQHLIDFVMSL